VLLNHFLRWFSETHRRGVPEATPEALQCLTAHSWPGNVRELRNIAERLVLRCGGGRIGVDALPKEVSREGWKGTLAAEPAQSLAAVPTYHVLFERLLDGGASFWSEVYEPFMSRDLTRHDLRELVRLGLEHTRGNYKMLVRTFNMPAEDYKRFLGFLRKYQCHVPFQRFRMVPGGFENAKDRQVARV
jgi:DNA-binding NtrC family response regulator